MFAVVAERLYFITTTTGAEANSPNLMNTDQSFLHRQWAGRRGDTRFDSLKIGVYPSAR